MLLLVGCDSNGVALNKCLSSVDTVDRPAIVANYSEFADSTTWTTSEGHDLFAAHIGTALRGAGSSLIPGVAFRCTGQGSCEPSSVNLLFRRTGLSRQLPDSAELIFLLNEGQRLRLGPATVTGDTTTFLGSVLVNESAKAKVDYVEFQRIACADTARYSIDGYEGRLTSQVTKRFRHLLAAAENQLRFNQVQDTTISPQGGAVSGALTWPDSLPNLTNVDLYIPISIPDYRQEYVRDAPVSEDADPLKARQSSWAGINDNNLDIRIRRSRSVRAARRQVEETLEPSNRSRDTVAGQTVYIRTDAGKGTLPSSYLMFRQGQLTIFINTSRLFLNQSRPEVATELEEEVKKAFQAIVASAWSRQLTDQG